MKDDAALGAIWQALAVVNGARTEDSVDLPAALDVLDQAAKDGRDDLDPRLRHFLERRSYKKAWEFLQPREGGTP